MMEQPAITTAGIMSFSLAIIVMLGQIITNSIFSIWGISIWGMMGLQLMSLLFSYYSMKQGNDSLSANSFSLSIVIFILYIFVAYASVAQLHAQCNTFM